MKRMLIVFFSVIMTLGNIMAENIIPQLDAKGEIAERSTVDAFDTLVQKHTQILLQKNPFKGTKVGDIVTFRVDNGKVMNGKVYKLTRRGIRFGSEEVQMFFTWDRLLPVDRFLLDRAFYNYQIRKQAIELAKIEQEQLEKEASLKRMNERIRQNQEQKERERQAAIERLNANPIISEYDRMEKITWYETIRDTTNAIYQGYRIEPYFGKRDDGTIILRMRTTYSGKSWVFYKRVKLLGDNNVEVEFATVYPYKKTEVLAGSVMEWCDNNLTIFSDKLCELAKSKTILVKFYGKYNCEFEMIPLQLQIFKEVIKKYQEIK